MASFFSVSPKQFFKLQIRLLVCPKKSYYINIQSVFELELYMGLLSRHHLAGGL